MKWSYKIQFYSLSGKIFYLSIKVRHAYHLTVLFKVFYFFLFLYLKFGAFFFTKWSFSLRNGVKISYFLTFNLLFYFNIKLKHK